MITGIVIVHPERGIFIGECMGLGFWSRLDPVGQPAAVAFESEETAREVLLSWGEDPDLFRFAEVDVDIPDRVAWGYASIDACARAGLPRWATSIRPGERVH